MSRRFLEGVWMVSEWCLQGVWKVSGRCFEGLWSERFMEGVLNMFGRRLELV